MSSSPTYDLERLQTLVASGLYRITESAFQGAAALELDESDILECVGMLSIGDFYKTMPSLKINGVMQDVYRPTYMKLALYVKLQELPTGVAVVISFKEL
jgi:hypothetical protein